MFSTRGSLSAASLLLTIVSMGLQALAEFDSATSPVPTTPSRPASAPSPLALALSSAYTTLPADLFYSVLQSTVLPHLERLTATDQDAIRKAFELATKEESEQSIAEPRALSPTPSQSDPREDQLRRRVEELNEAQVRFIIAARDVFAEPFGLPGPATRCAKIQGSLFESSEISLISTTPFPMQRLPRHGRPRPPRNRCSSPPKP